MGLPPGGIYRGQANSISAIGDVGRITTGVLFLGNAGWSFSRKDETVPVLTVGWHEVIRISLGPYARGIGVGHLVLHGGQGNRWAFAVPRYGKLADSLRLHAPGS
jgi:hypothetical protein